MKVNQSKYKWNEQNGQIKVINTLTGREYHAYRTKYGKIHSDSQTSLMVVLKAHKLLKKLQ